MSEKELLYFIGESSKLNYLEIKNALEYFLKHPEILERYSNNSYELIDGLGARRCANEIFS